MPKPTKIEPENDENVPLDEDTPLGALTPDDMKEVLESLPGYQDYLREQSRFEN